MSLRPEDLEKSLQELESHDMGEPGYASNLVVTCHRLHATPLKDFDPGDLRIMIGQDLGLKYLIPLAMDQLEINPWIEATFYEGDLLQYVLNRSDFWKDNPHLKTRVDQIVAKASEAYLASDSSDADHYDQGVLMDIANWSKPASEPGT